jgi:hypothetical protein
MNNQKCNHNDQKYYQDTPDHKRQGWIETRCKVCGKWIGYRMSDAKQDTKQSQCD